MLVTVSDANVVGLQSFLGMLVTSLNNRLRYADNCILVVVDEKLQKVFLLGTLAGVFAAQNPTTFGDLSERLVQSLDYNRAVQ